MTIMVVVHGRPGVRPAGSRAPVVGLVLLRMFASFGQLVYSTLVVPLLRTKADLLSMATQKGELQVSWEIFGNHRVHRNLGVCGATQHHYRPRVSMSGMLGCEQAELLVLK